MKFHFPFDILRFAEKHPHILFATRISEFVYV